MVASRQTATPNPIEPAASGALAVLSRYVGHLLLAGLLLLVAWNVSPRELDTPALTRWITLQPATEPASAVEGQAEAPAETGYLERNVVPLTVRPIRQVLPNVTTPQRSVRTTVLVYRVQAGDTVLGIAQKFGLEGTSLLYANEVLMTDPDSLQIGQALNILPVDGAYHTVAKGETLESLAAKYKVSPEAIHSYGGNRLQPPYALEPGTRLIVPNGIRPEPPPQRASISQQMTQAPKGAKVGSGRFAWPISGMISQKYWAGHPAIDIAGPSGSPVVAADAGFVASIQSGARGYGNMIVLDHGNGYQTLYAHLQAFKVEIGQSVARGEVIGLRGSSGRSTGPHLHFEVILNGARQNPFSYLP